MRMINVTILTLMLVSSPSYAVTESIFTYMNSGDNAMWTRQFVGDAPTRTNAMTGQTAKTRIVTSLPANIYSRSEVENLYYEVVVDFYYPNGNLHKTVSIDITRAVSLIAGTTDYKPSFAMSYTYELIWPSLNDCTCGACCSCKCECGEWSGDICGGTHADCECHECNHCCSCTCDCEGGWQGVTCQGHAAGEACEGNGCSTWGDAYHCDCHKSCECEACCSCECTCGEWQGEICGGEPEDCECHEEEGEEGCKDCENCGGCCEHHKKDYKPPPDVDYSSVGRPGVRDMSNPDFSETGFESPGTRPVPEFVFFEWDPETGELPKFRSEEAWETFAERIGEKFNLDFLGPFGRGETDYGPSQNDLLFKIDFEIFGVKVGPYEYDMMTMFRNDLGGNLASVIRVILLFIVTFSGIVGTLNLLFWAK